MTLRIASRLIALFAAVLTVSVSPLAGAETPPIGHKTTAWERSPFATHRASAMKFGDRYRDFVSLYKTEREFVAAALTLAQKRGFRDLLATGSRTNNKSSRNNKRTRRLEPGAKLYAQVHDKLTALIVVGKRPLREGMHVVASHVDAVRLDLKQNPLYADGNLALLQTHYYGGIKPYQWLSVPLELRGVVVNKRGKRTTVSIGAKADDPVLVIPDIAAHVAWRVDNIEGEAVRGEALDPIVSSTPARGGSKRRADPFAAEATRLLKKHYGVDVADLASAELELVPAWPARDVGLDRAIVGGYGQDDRACSYAAVRALLDAPAPKHTAIVILADKEEIGSAGNTGARSVFIRRITAELLEATGVASTEATVDRVLGNSIVFSADVSGAVNPTYRRLYDAHNASFMGSGVIWNQSAVHAELMAYVRTLFDGAGITHQPSSWTRVAGSKSEDGTILPFFTAHGMNGLTVSIALLSMHAPFELVSKADLYEGFRAYRAFLRD